MRLWHFEFVVAVWTVFAHFALYMLQSHFKTILIGKISAKKYNEKKKYEKKNEWEKKTLRWNNNVWKMETWWISHKTHFEHYQMLWSVYTFSWLLCFAIKISNTSMHAIHPDSRSYTIRNAQKIYFYHYACATFAHFTFRWTSLHIHTQCEHNHVFN